MSSPFEGTLGILQRSDIQVGERFRKDYGNVKELADSIAGPEGLISPVAVRAKNGHYELAAGGRRMAAIDLLGWTEVPCRIYPPETDDFTILVVELAENVKRKDMEWAEQAALVARIHDMHVEKYGEKTSTTPDAPGHSVRDTAKLLNVSHTSVQNDLALADAVSKVPALKLCKNKAEAKRVLDKTGERIMMRELASQAQTIMNSSNATKRITDAYVIGDFFKQKLPDNYFDLVEIDPPYGIDVTTRKDTCSLGKSTDFGIYNEVPDTEYPEFLAKLMDKVYKAMANDSWLVFWFSSQWIQTVYDEIIRAGFACPLHPAIWIKTASGQPGISAHPKTRLASAYEMFFYARKGNAEIVQHGKSNVFDYAPVNTADKLHPTERPLDMMADILTTFTRPTAKVLVPFAGSGVTLRAAFLCQMQPIGFDLAGTYKDGYVLQATKDIVGGA